MRHAAAGSASSSASSWCPMLDWRRRLLCRLVGRDVEVAMGAGRGTHGLHKQKGRASGWREVKLTKSSAIARSAGDSNYDASLLRAPAPPPPVVSWATRPGDLGGPFGVSSSAGDLSASGLGGAARPLLLGPWGLRPPVRTTPTPLRKQRTVGLGPASST